MLKIGSVKWKGRCLKHSMYDPEIDGLGGIRAGCHRCQLLLDIYQHHRAMVRLIREFGTREEPRSGAAAVEERQLSLLD